MGRAEDEVVSLTSELIQIDSQNTGELATTTGEAEAAAYVDAKLREVGFETEVIESGTQCAEPLTFGAVWSQQGESEATGPVHADPAVADVQDEREAQQVAVEPLTDVEVADGQGDVVDAGEVGHGISSGGGWRS